MRLMGKVSSQEVIVLIDTGSTYTFVNPNVARKAHLSADGKGQLTVMVVDGATLSCQGHCKVVYILLQGCSFNTSLYLLPLGGCDMVLRVNWLRFLGPILWDFTGLTMRFTYHNQDVQLQRLTISPDLLDARDTIP